MINFLKKELKGKISSCWTTKSVCIWSQKKYVCIKVSVERYSTMNIIFFENYQQLYFLWRTVKFVYTLKIHFKFLMRICICWIRSPKTGVKQILYKGQGTKPRTYYYFICWERALHELIHYKKVANIISL